MFPGLDAQSLPLLTLVVCRLGGVMATSPWWNSSAVPARWRMAVVVLLALLVTPAVAAHHPESVRLPCDGLPLVLAGLQEAALGAVTGVALRLMWSAIAWTVQLLGPLSGLALGETFDPASGESSPALGQLMQLTAAAAWFGIGGHRQVLAALLDTFAVAPPGTVAWDESLLPLLTSLLAQSCLAGVRAGAPLAAVLLAGWLVVLGAARLAPRSAAWMWGASLATILGLAGASLTMGYMCWTFQESFDVALDAVSDTWSELAAARSR